MAAAMDLSEWEKDPRLFLFTSLTAGSSHIITATSRLETILKANKIPFQAIDTATDDKARRLWGRRAGKKKLPGLVKEGYVIGDLEEIEEWNEFGELKENIGPVPSASTSVNGVQTTLGSLRMHDAASQAAASKPMIPTSSGMNTKVADVKTGSGGPVTKIATPLVHILKEQSSSTASPAASAPTTAPATTSKPALSSLEAADEATKPETMNSSVETKTQSIRTAEDTSQLASQPTSNLAEPSASGSAIVPTVSTDSTASAVASPETAEEKKHRGSSVSGATAEEIKEVEQRTMIPEEEEDENQGNSASAQPAAAPEKAGVSVED